MSGGLDSTAISVLAARALGQESRPPHTYSFVSELRHDVQFVDERPYVDATTQAEPNIYNTKIYPSDRDDAYIDVWADRMSGFFGAEEKVLDAADSDLVDVILSGWGATRSARSTVGALTLSIFSAADGECSGASSRRAPASPGRRKRGSSEVTCYHTYYRIRCRTLCAGQPAKRRLSRRSRSSRSS